MRLTAAHIIRTFALLACLVFTAHASAQTYDLGFAVGDTIAISNPNHTSWITVRNENGYKVLATTSYNDMGYTIDGVSSPYYNLWIVEGVSDGRGGNLPNQYALYNLGYQRAHGTKHYLTIAEVRRNGNTFYYHVLLSTQKSVWHVDAGGLYQNITNSKKRTAKIYFYAAGTNNAHSDWSSHLVQIDNAPAQNNRNRYVVYHYKNEPKIVYGIGETQYYFADYTSGTEFVWQPNSMTRYFALPLKLFTGVEKFEANIGNGQYDYILPDDRATQICNNSWNCGQLTTLEYRFATGELAPATCQIVANTNESVLQITTRNNPTTNTAGPIIDTLYATVHYGATAFEVCIPMKQHCTFLEPIDRMEISFDPDRKEFTENKYDSVDFTLRAQLVRGEKIGNTQNSSISENITRTDTVLALTLAEIGIARLDELSAGWSYKLLGGNRVRVYVTQSAQTIDNINASLHANVRYKGELITTSAAISQIVNTESFRFNHQKGASGRDLLPNGMQATHTSTQVIYMMPGNTKELQVPESSFQGYFRWYNYDTDRKTSTDVTYDGAWQFNQTPYGHIRDNAAVSSNKVSYTMPNSFPKDGVVRIACDMSNYTDFVSPWKNRECTEPTLSTRAIFEIRHASQMADKLTPCRQTGTNKYLEEINIIAGTCNNIYIGPSLPFSGNYNGYWFYPSNNPAQNPKAVDGPKWYQKRVSDVNATQITSPTILNGQFLSVKGTAADVGKTVTYTLQSNGYFIAKINVTYFECDSIGPKTEQYVGEHVLISDAEIRSNYKELARLDFNYDRPGTENPRNYDKPLMWDECSYGFTYPSSGAPTHRRPGSATYLPYYGEYAFINKTKWGNPSDGWSYTNFVNRGGAAEGYMLYCDGTTKPGKVVSLDLQASLCAGSKMFCSAWLGVVNNTNGRPIFQFELVGIDHMGQEHLLTTYTTGEMNLTGKWVQVNFPIESNHDYQQYRLSIVNHCGDVNGNDFIVDDVVVYAEETNIGTRQTNTVCASDSEEDITVLGRIDFSTFPFLERNNYTLFYQWYNSTVDSIVAATYLDVRADNPVDWLIPGRNYGVAKPLSQEAVVHRPEYLYSSFEAFDANYKASLQLTIDDIEELTDAELIVKNIPESGWEAYRQADRLTKLAMLQMFARFGYVKEPTEKNPNDSTYVFYGYESMQAKKNETIVLRLAYAEEELDQSLCAMSREFRVLPRAEVLLDGMPMNEEINTICANQHYNLTVRVHDGDGSSTFCKADWLRGKPRENSDAENRETYGYTWEEIKEAIYDLRHPTEVEQNGFNTLNPNLTIATPNGIYEDFITNSGQNGKPATKEVITELVNRGLLNLASDNQTFIITNPKDLKETDHNGLVFPIDGTAQQNVMMCEDPIPTLFDVCKDGGFELSIGRTKEHGILFNRVRNIRVENNVKTFYLPMDTANAVKIDTVFLYQSDDPEFVSPEVSHIPLIPSHKEFVNWATAREQLTPRDTLVLTIDESHTNLTLKDGYTYTFGIRLVNFTDEDSIQSGEIKCPVGTTYFNVYVVPHRVMWNPDGQNTSWNNDKNWQICDEQGNPLPGRGFVPMEHTDVLISNQSLYGYYPILNTKTDVNENQYLPVEKNAEGFITYDFCYQPNKCRNIYFDTYGQLVNSHKLQYKTAYAGLHLGPFRWHIMGVPIWGVVSGDIYVPADHKSSLLFSENNDEPNRYLNSCYISMFNQNLTQLHEDGSKIDIASATWTAPVNALTQPLYPGRGVAFHFYPTTDGVTPDESMKFGIACLPKGNDKYYYHYADGSPSSKFETVIRQENYGRLAFEPTMHADGEYVEIPLQNATPGRLFAVANSAMAALNIQEFMELNKDILTGTYYHIPEELMSDQLSMEVCTPKTYTVDQMFIKSMHGVLLESKEACTQISVKVAPSMYHLFRAQLDAADDGTIPGHEEYLVDPGSDPMPEPVVPTLAASVSSRAVRAARISEQNNLAMMHIFAEFGDYQSTLELGEKSSASNSFVRGEDAEVLIFSGDDNWIDNANAHTIIYSPQDDKALTVNILSELQSVPISYRCVDGNAIDRFTLWFFGVGNFEYGLQFYDSQNDIVIPLCNNLRLELEGTESDQVRYYIQRLGYDNHNTGDDVTTDCFNATTSEIAAYTQPNQMVHVVADQTITNVSVFTASGQLVYEQNDLGDTKAAFTLPQGAYMLHIATDAGSAVRKVIVK